MLRPRGCHRFFCGGSRFLFGGVGNTVASHQQPVGVDPKRGTRHQRDLILAVLNLEQARVRGQHRIDGVHLIGQHLAQHVDVKRVALCKLVNVRKQLGPCHTTVRR